MINGLAPGPARKVSTMPRTTPDSGSLRTAVTPAAMPTATAGVSSKPGSCAAIMPPAAPRNMAGSPGPQQKLPSERPYATPLNASSSARAESDQAPGYATSESIDVSPENSASLTLLSAAWENPIASPATARPTAGTTRNGLA